MRVAPLVCLIVAAVTSVASAADAKPRARELGIPFDGTPGQLNAITDVAPVAVGYTTLIDAAASHRDGRRTRT